MATKKKLLQAAAGNAGGAGLNVEDVFSTYLYTGNGSTQTITNGIDLDGEGGLVWIKSRTGTTDHWLSDSERASTTRFLRTNLTNAEANNNASVTSYSADGFSVGSAFAVNTNNQDYTSWTFRKAPKFFDVVTYTGDGASGQTINHNLGTDVGAIIIKCTDTNTNWAYWHRTFGSQEMIILNSTGGSRTDLPYVSNVTDSSFTVNGSSSFVNENTKSHVAYLFAHNNSDGEFGPDGDADIIKCGSYTGTSSSDAINQIDLGFEPQWLLIKGADYPTGWQLFDNMRGIVIGGNDARLFADTSGAEGQSGDVDINATGFYPASGSFNTNKQDKTYIYIAIRRGTAVPESATDVFATAFDAGATDPTYVSGFVTDMGIQTNTGGYNKRVSSRLTSGRFLEADNTGAEGISTSNYTWDFMNGWNNQTINSTWLSWMWKRAPKYFDVVAYTGTGSTRTVAHNLGAAPEMMWFKGRNQSAYNWMVYHKSISPANGIYLSDGGAAAGASFQFANTAPTATAFTVSSGVDVNSSNEPYIAYLFASLDGISKVGSVTHSGTTNVDCGFSSGARFVLLKRTDATGDWYVWDSVRGIVSGNDPYLLLNSTAAEVTNTDYIDPLSSGFTITSSFTAGDYIFYAVS